MSCTWTGKPSARSGGWRPLRTPRYASSNTGLSESLFSGDALRKINPEETAVKIQNCVHLVACWTLSDFHWDRKRVHELRWGETSPLPHVTPSYPSTVQRRTTWVVFAPGKLRCKWCPSVVVRGSVASHRGSGKCPRAPADEDISDAPSCTQSCTPVKEKLCSGETLHSVHQKRARMTMKGKRSRALGKVYLFRASPKENGGKTKSTLLAERLCRSSTSIAKTPEDSGGRNTL